MVLVLSNYEHVNGQNFVLGQYFDLFFVEFSILKDVRSGTAHKM